MSRPLKAGLDYFPHDTDAANDNKIQSLMALYGCEGYAFYFILCEKIYRSENGVLPMGKPIEKAGITRILGLNIEKFDEILSSALEVGCFDIAIFQDTKCLTSSGIKKRIERIKVLRERERTKKETIKYKEKEKAKTRKTPVIPRENPKYPDWLPVEEFQAFIEMRTKAKKKPTEHAIALLIKELEKLKNQGDDPIKVIEKSIMNGWQGFYPLKGDKNANSRGTKQTSHGEAGKDETGSSKYDGLGTVIDIGGEA